MTPQPRLLLREQPHPTRKDQTVWILVGFDQFDRWAFVQSSLWSSVHIDCVAKGISDLDRMKLTAAVLLEQNEKFRKTITRYLAQFGPIEPPIPQPPARAQPKE